ncbi:MAG: hypothetical protein SPI74_03305 [Eubacterium sp.]|nr:hypothetical protein [Eubacterium sp.]
MKVWAKGLANEDVKIGDTIKVIKEALSHRQGFLDYMDIYRADD